MNVAEALNTLISAVNVAYKKGEVYSLEEAHYIFLAISYLNSLSQEGKTEQGTTPTEQGTTPTEQGTTPTEQPPSPVEEQANQQYPGPVQEY